MIYCSVNDTGIPGKRKSECSYQESNHRYFVNALLDSLPLFSFNDPELYTGVNLKGLTKITGNLYCEVYVKIPWQRKA